MKIQTLYIGPGMGAGYLAVIIGIVTSFLLSLIAIFWYPLKRLINYFRSKTKTK